MAIDSRLKWMLSERTNPEPVFHEAVAMLEGPAVNESAWAEVKWIDVLVRAVVAAEREGFVAELNRIGFEVHSVVGNAGAYSATGRVLIDDLVRLDTSPMVGRVEAPRELMPELTVSMGACGASSAHAMIPAAQGRKALVGIVDSGIDYTHPVFLGSAGSRIVALWDQSSPTVPGGSVPYGVEYTKAELDAVLSNVKPIHSDPDAHGTHVASIAAGAGPRAGVAPEATLLIVSLAGSGGNLGRSKNAIDAIDWLIRQAQDRNLPVAINISQGMNGGGHVGSSLLELAIDAYCRLPGVAIVKSAGNEQEWRIHATGSLLPGPLTLEVACQPGKFLPGQLEIWFDESVDLEFSIHPPFGSATQWLNHANTPRTFNFAGGNRVRVDVEFDPEGTNDNLLSVFLSAGGSAIGLVPGTWRILLRSASAGAVAPIHAWLERTNRSPVCEQLRFSPASDDPRCTITVPGTARRVITVGSYVTAPTPHGSALVGALSSFSSCGPTRFDVQKPDLVAPGEWIEAARSAQSHGTGQWVSMQGTSMAAPHVTGAAALLLSENAQLTGEQVRQILSSTATPTTSTPSNAFGCGKLDVARAVQLARSGNVAFPVVTSTKIAGATFEIVTAEDSTASLLYDTSAGRVLAGRRLGSLPSLVPTKTHSFDLTSLGSGTWFFEVHVFASTWRTIADDNGAAWSIVLP